MNESFLKQVHFTGETQCEEFKPNPFKANICVICCKEISKHKASSIRSQEILMKALEYSQSFDKLGSVILPSNGESKTGGLYLGGYKSSMNKKFIVDNQITHIVNAAKNLASFFGPKYENTVKEIVRELKIEYLSLCWVDDEDFSIPVTDVMEAISFIHNGLTKGNVLVHCAQGKSRSSTVVIAYVMASKKLSLNDALKLVQEKRKMAQPNPGFMKFYHI
ncbi:dual specificity protein phosphatase 1B-like [Xenia sp. Carnegie-2017]|uniref:dual specificity protein phosphatase 1B-like n=1 Tax=Xenia sp. Carnegie-2017 TaxID=2897299 RepID=UPI001F039C73|nr:dual specificity protein phosphatase 1B-like [Xenia sp. Carnegie-2017]